MEDLYKTIDIIIEAQKKARRNNDFVGVMTNAEALLEYLPSLINHSVNQEAEYRKFEAKLSNEKDEFSKRFSSSYCETQAKATDFYKEWQRAKLFIDLLFEFVNMAKKLAGSVNKEFNAN